MVTPDMLEKVVINRTDVQRVDEGQRDNGQPNGRIVYYLGSYGANSNDQWLEFDHRGQLWFHDCVGADRQIETVLQVRRILGPENY